MAVYPILFIFNSILQLPLMKTIVSLLFLMVLACNQGDPGPETLEEATYSRDMEAMAVKTAAPQPESATQGRERKDIKNGGLSFESENLEADYKAIKTMLPSYNAYIENENQSRSSQRLTYDLSIRVPAGSYDSLMTTLSGFGERLESKYSNTQDVTERYYDLQTRIRNKQELESRYLQLLQKASELKDMLEIENNLNEVRTEIENLQGQFNYLSNQVSLSSIQLSFYEQLPYVYEGSQRKGFWARILSALHNGWQGFLTFLVVLITIWPALLLLTGAVLFFRWLWGYYRRN